MIVILSGFQKEKAAEEEPEIDPDVAAMMGFGGFGSSKKWSHLFMYHYILFYVTLVVQAFGGWLTCKVSRFRKDRKVKNAWHASFAFQIPSSVMEKLLNLSIYGCMVDLLTRDNGLWLDYLKIMRVYVMPCSMLLLWGSMLSACPIEPRNSGKLYTVINFLCGRMEMGWSREIKGMDQGRVSMEPTWSFFFSVHGFWR